VYHLLPFCHVYIEAKIKLSASECYLFFETDKDEVTPASSIAGALYHKL